MRKNNIAPKSVVQSAVELEDEFHADNDGFKFRRSQKYRKKRNFIVGKY